MHLKLNQDQKRFVDEVRLFLDRHWQERSGEKASRQPAVFLGALVERGWSVPDWPEFHGGTGWSRLERHMFDREMAAVAAPRMDAFSVDLMGPMLIEAATVAQCERYLPPIRARRERWCMHGSFNGSPALTAATTSNGVRLQEGSLLAYDALGASRAALLVTVDGASPTLAILSLNDARVEAGLPLDPDRVEVDAGLLEVLGEPGQGERLVGSAFDRLARLPHSAASRARASLIETTRKFETLALEDEGLTTRLHETEIALLGLDVLEQRAVAGGEAMYAELSAARLKTREALLELSAITIDALGYHALPGFDRKLFDNEGPVGPDFGRDAIEDVFRYVGGLKGMVDRDRIAALKF